MIFLKRAIHNCTLYDVHTKTVRDNVTILWENGIIKYVGKNIDIPSDVDMIDGEGKHVTPGLIHSFSFIGLKEYGLRWEGDDSTETSDIVQPHLSVIDGIYPFDKAFSVARAYGVTMAHIAPGPENIISGKTAITKTVGNVVDEMVIQSEQGLAVSFGEIPKRAHQQKFNTRLTRMRIAYTIREHLRKAMYSPDSAIAKEEIFQRILNQEAPLFIRAHRADDIVTAIRLQKEFNIQVVLVHATEAFKITETLKQADLPVIAGPFYSPKSREELKGLHPSTATKLFESNIHYTLISNAVRNLTLEGALSVREGISRIEAIRSITLNAAKILGLSKNYGSIEVGKKADIVLWDSPPLELTTNVFKTIVDGITVYNQEEKEHENN